MVGVGLPRLAIGVAVAAGRITQDIEQSDRPCCYKTRPCDTRSQDVCLQLRGGCSADSEVECLHAFICKVAGNIRAVHFDLHFGGTGFVKSGCTLCIGAHLVRDLQFATLCRYEVYHDSFTVRYIIIIVIFVAGHTKDVGRFVEDRFVEQVPVGCLVVNYDFLIVAILGCSCKVGIAEVVERFTAFAP